MLAKYGVEWMSGGAKRQCDRALASPRGRPGTCCCTGSALPARAQDTSAPAAKQDAGGIDASRDRPARPQIRARSVRATGHGATGDRAGAGGGAAHVVAQAAHLLDVPDLARGEDLAGGGCHERRGTVFPRAHGLDPRGEDRVQDGRAVADGLVELGARAAARASTTAFQSWFRASGWFRSRPYNGG